VTSRNYRILSDFGNQFGFSQSALYSHTRAMRYTAKAITALPINLKSRRESASTATRRAYYASNWHIPAALPSARQRTMRPLRSQPPGILRHPDLGSITNGRPGLMTYVSAAEGFKSGGFNGRAGTVAAFNEYGPEKVRTYEGGIAVRLVEQPIALQRNAFLQCLHRSATPGQWSRPGSKRTAGPRTNCRQHSSVTHQGCGTRIYCGAAIRLYRQCQRRTCRCPVYTIAARCARYPRHSIY